MRRDELYVFTARKRSLRQGNVFTGVCVIPSVDSGVGFQACIAGRRITPPPPCEIHGILRYTVNKRTVRILLECILVVLCFEQPQYVPQSPLEFSQCC